MDEGEPMSTFLDILGMIVFAYAWIVVFFILFIDDGDGFKG